MEEAKGVVDVVAFRKCSGGLWRRATHGVESARGSLEKFPPFKKLSAAVHEYIRRSVTAADAVHLATPLWRARYFPIIVLFEA